MTWPKADTYPDPMPAVAVEWVDSHRTGDGWTPLEDLRALAADPARLTCRSCGYLLHKGPHGLTLIQSVSGRHGTEGMTIPREAVRSVRELK